MAAAADIPDPILRHVVAPNITQRIQICGFKQERVAHLFNKQVSQILSLIEQLSQILAKDITGGYTDYL
jgi:hypothetical protein